MAKYIAKRVALAIVTLLVLTSIRPGSSDAGRSVLK